MPVITTLFQYYLDSYHIYALYWSSIINLTQIRITLILITCEKYEQIVVSKIQHMDVAKCYR